MGHHSILLRGLSICALLSGVAALSTEFLQTRHEQVFDFHKQTEEVFDFHKAGARAGFGFYRAAHKHHLDHDGNFVADTKVDHEVQHLKTPGQGNAQVVDSTNKVDAGPLSISFHIQGRVAGASRTTQILIIVVGLILLTGLVAFLISRMEDESAGVQEDNTAKIAKAILSSSTGYPQSISASSCPPPKTKKMLFDTMEGGDGTWATTYRSSTGLHKDALELLFRCHIIPRQEFATSRVSQEHIDECMWISMHLLRQRSLDDWVRQTPEAQQAFEDSVTACFSARTDVVDPRTDSQKLDVHGLAVTLLVDNPTEVPKAETDFQRRLNFMQTGPRSLPTSTKKTEEMALHGKDSAGQNLLIMRCREIMAANRPGRPWPVQDNVAGCSTQTLPPPATHERSPFQSQRSMTVPNSGPRVKLDKFEVPVEAVLGEEYYPDEMEAQEDGGWHDVQHDMQYQQQQYDMQHDMQYQGGPASSTSAFAPGQQFPDTFYK